MTEQRDVLARLTQGYTIEPGYVWGMRSVRYDFSSSRGFRWPFPGNWAEAAGPFTNRPDTGCPSKVGDGICTATTFEGMASGGVPAHVVLLTAHSMGDVLGSEPGKVRARRIYVVDVVDMPAWLRGTGAPGANLSRANLYGANLYGADLTGANLSRALNVPSGAGSSA